MFLGTKGVFEEEEEEVVVSAVASEDGRIGEEDNLVVRWGKVEEDEVIGWVTLGKVVGATLEEEGVNVALGVGVGVTLSGGGGVGVTLGGGGGATLAASVATTKGGGKEGVQVEG